jgi:hypothetical protein
MSEIVRDESRHHAAIYGRWVGVIAAALALAQYIGDWGGVSGVGVVFSALIGLVVGGIAYLVAYTIVLWTHIYYSKPQRVEATEAELEVELDDIPADVWVKLRQIAGQGGTVSLSRLEAAGINRTNGYAHNGRAYQSKAHFVQELLQGMGWVDGSMQLTAAALSNLASPTPYTGQDED